MMFTERMQGNVPYEDHLAMFFLEAHVQVSCGVIAESCEEERVGFGDAAGCSLEAFPFRVFAYGYQYLPDGGFDLWCV
jgi:hypothetical protein